MDRSIVESTCSCDQPRIIIANVCTTVAALVQANALVMSDFTPSHKYCDACGLEDTRSVLTWSVCLNEMQPVKGKAFSTHRKGTVVSAHKWYNAKGKVVSMQPVKNAKGKVVSVQPFKVNLENKFLRSKFPDLRRKKLFQRNDDNCVCCQSQLSLWCLNPSPAGEGTCIFHTPSADVVDPWALGVFDPTAEHLNPPSSSGESSQGSNQMDEQEPPQHIVPPWVTVLDNIMLGIE